MFFVVGPSLLKIVITKDVLAGVDGLTLATPINSHLHHIVKFGILLSKLVRPSGWRCAAWSFPLYVSDDAQLFETCATASRYMADVR